MAYVKKLLTQDEKLIGIARLHWIYVLKGLGWFLVLAGGGWAINSVITRGVLMLASSTNSTAMPAALLQIADSAMYFLMGGGFFVFFLFVMKVLVTEVALSSRRIIHKEGLLFVKVHQVDVEEIRGENLDLGNLGRLLGYGFINLDCRFVGDVRLPAIENPERFIKALHEVRGKSQDALSVVLGKGNAIPVADASVLQDGPDTPQPQQPTPEIQPGQPGPAPEVQPGNTPQGPEIPSMPTPHNPPPQPEQPQQPVTPPPQPPVPAPPPSEPPLQPPASQGAAMPSATAAAASAASMQTAQGQTVHADHVTLDPAAVAQVVQQVMPQMAQQVVKQMSEQGLIAQPQPAPEQDGVDNDLIASFDDARLDKDEHNNGMHNKLEYAVH